ncbi:enoyl-CoA hydratase-related protein [Salinisphaera aquimarina]|uniref:Enoyl-CoA hydratase-related protein n=1 Tax=Salinisphaera aquimarina TaxID=2094031 RepID=A0ABV7EPQ1_9GAMM
MSETKTPHVELQLEHGIARLTLCNPEHRNAITRRMWEELTQITSDLAIRRDLRVVMIRGVGPDAFASGADISEFGENRRSSEQAADHTAAIQEAIDGIEAIPVPVVALIHGFCIGAGTAIALACDLRYLDNNARFGIPAARLGIGYSPLWIKRLVDVVGRATAGEILMTGQFLSADKALRCGFANEVVPAADLDEFVEKQLAVIAANAPLSVAAAKVSLREIAAFDRDRDWQAPFAAVQACAESSDYQSALTAFANKQTPVFYGE